MKTLVLIFLLLALCSSAWAPPLTPPLALTIMYDVPTTSLILRWQANGAPFYNVYRGTSSSPIATVTTTSYTDPIGAMVKGCYTVTATNGASLQSGPSNIVGFVKTICLGGTGTVSTLFSQPFRTWDVVSGVPSYGVPSSSPSDIIGIQTACGNSTTADRIVRDDINQFAYRNASCAWTGSLETSALMVRNQYYHYENRSHTDRSIVLAGDLDSCLAIGADHWMMADSPVYVISDITVPTGQTLTIDPGVEVRFRSHCKLVIQGTLVAMGTVQDSIRFTCDTLQNPQKWAGIRFLNTGNNSSILQYCVIENGHADGTSSEDRVGGGVFSMSTNIRLYHCTFRNCSAVNSGGAFYGALSQGADIMDIDSCAFEYNTALNAGGAIRLDQTQFNIYACTFADNHSTGGVAGAVYVEIATGFNQQISNSAFTHNTAATDGGAIYLYQMNGSIGSCSFDHDSAGDRGGALVFNQSSPSITGCFFHGNFASSAGAVYLLSGSPLMSSCTFSQNNADAAGTFEIQDNAANATITNSIIAFSTSAGVGAVYYGAASNTVFRYCDFFGNIHASIRWGEAPAWAEVLTIVNHNGDSCDANYNIYLDPMFVDTAAGDYHLRPCSSCIDGGDPDSPHDLDGTLADIGAISFSQAFAPPREPANLTVHQLSPTSLRLTWSPVTQDVNGGALTVCDYAVERSLDAEFASPEAIGKTSDTTFTDNLTVAGNAEAFYRVKAATNN